jgi:hypothetical protein
MPAKPNSTTIKKAAATVAAATAEGPVPNCTWSNNNIACVNTWFCLSKKVLGQIDCSFDDAQTLKMTDLEYWNEVAPGDNREVEAQALADMLTKIFTNVMGAAYEKGQTYATAVPAMTTVLTDPDKTICELAAVVDELHHFLGEA